MGHALTCAMAHRDKAYAVLLTPDCMLSDGSVARLAELARAGTELVLTAALRFGEEPFMAHLENMGALPKVSRGATGTSLDVRVLDAASGRPLANASVAVRGTPNVANLAGKILAVNPKLTPVEVIALVRETADRSADGRRVLINPKKAIAAAGARNS